MNRVLVILDSLNAGGAETFMMKLYRKLNKAHYQMDFIVCQEGIYDEEVATLGGKIYQIPLRTRNFFKAFFEIKRIVKENNYSNVLKLGSSPIIVTDLIAAKMGGAKNICVRTCNAPTNIHFKKKIINSILRPIMNMLCDTKIAPSDLAAEYTFGKRLVQLKKVNFLHNAVDLDYFYFDQHKRSAIREEFHISDEQFVIGHIGRFTKQKNHEHLLNVFKEITSIDNNAILLLVGQGELFTEIKNLAISLKIEDKVIFAGLRRDIPAILSAIDVFALPSFHEGMPNTVIEAQATGLPCVISDAITKEADITGLVTYVSLQKEYVQWADMIMSKKNSVRKNQSGVFVRNKYDINSAVGAFTKYVFKNQ